VGFTQVAPEPKSDAKIVHDSYEIPTKADKNLTAYGRLMAMEGLEEVKADFARIKTMIEESRRREGQLRRQDLNLVLTGNPGTGL
jgi:DNA replication protein DnaC